MAARYEWTTHLNIVLLYYRQMAAAGEVAGTVRPGQSTAWVKIPLRRRCDVEYPPWRSTFKAVDDQGHVLLRCSLRRFLG